MRVFLGVSEPAWWDVFERKRAARFLALSLFWSFVAVAAACGGGQVAPGGAQSANTVGNSVPAAGAPQAADAPTTTTETLADAGDVKGTELTEKGALATRSPSTPAIQKSPHSQEPGRARDDIRAIIIAHRNEARACYDKILEDHPGMEGDLVVSWTIDPKGSVTQIALDVSRSQITEPQLVACVSDVIRRIQFAASAGGFETRASYPFNFHPRHVKQAP